jgi:hypothetical protein
MLVDRAGFRGFVACALVALLSAAVVLLSAPPEAHGIETCSRVYHKPPLGDAPGLAKPPLLIGDSVVGFAMKPLQKLGYRINAQGCRTFPRGITAIKREAHKRELPSLIVVELGTAGNVTRQNIGRLLRLLGPDRKLVLVTPRKFGGTSFSGGVDPDAKDYHRAAERYPGRVFVTPWAEFGEQHPEWFYPDMVHPNPEGQKAFVAFLEAALYV